MGSLLDAGVAAATSSDLSDNEHGSVLAEERKIFPELNIGDQLNTLLLPVGIVSNTRSKVDSKSDKETIEQG